MFDVGDLPVMTFGNCVLQTGVIKWPLSSETVHTLLNVFFDFLIPKKHDFTFLS